MPETWRQRSGPAKLATLSAALILLGLGLCGVRFVRTGYDLPEFVPVFGMFFLIIGVLGLLMAALWAGAN
jgi:hypothetical protein